MTEQNVSQELPAPLVPADVDLRDLDGFMLNVERLLSSELWALTKNSPEAFRAAVGLWARAWKQVPAASLPGEMGTLAAFADMTEPKLKKLWNLVMRGFVLCSDGRYYHRVLAPEALRAWDRKKAYQARRDADRKRLDEWRKKRRGNGGGAHGETPPETPDETRFVAEDTGQGQGQGRGRKKEPASQDGAPSLEGEVFRRGKAILGSSAGGHITNLRQALRNDDMAALAILNEAKTKENPREWIAGVIKRRGAEPPTDALGLPTTPISELGKATDELYRRWGVRD